MLLSALLHVPLLLVVSLLSPADPSGANRDADASDGAFSIEVVTEEEPKPKPEDPDANLQHVSLERPEREETPDEARFADQYESKTEQEQVRKALPGARAVVAPSTTPTPPPARHNAESEQETDNPEGDDAPEIDPVDDGVTAQHEAGGSPPGPPSLIPPSELFPALTSEIAAELLGEGGSHDYLRDVAEGEKTLLNRKRTRYWAFFDRVKQQVLKQWSPASEYRKRDPHGHVYGVKDRYATVDVTLNGDGSVRRLYVSRDSGLDFYDDEAIRALKTAAPFHNPPEGLKDEDGLLHFTFGFYFEISSGSFRFMRINR